MNILILEGIATSGKSTIITELSKDLSAKISIMVADETETHIPIMEKLNESHIGFYLDLINDYLNKRADVVIFDRLYLTQAFRANIGLKEYEPVEKLLLPHAPLTIFLKVDEGSIAERVSKATEHRDSEWGEYVKTRGASVEEIAQYYIEQQRNQLQLLKQSIIPYTIFDTTNHDYTRIKNEIIKELKLKINR